MFNWKPFTNRDAIKPNDKGIFDPYLPISQIGKVKGQFQDEPDGYYEPTHQADLPLRKPDLLVLRFGMVIVLALLSVRLIGLQITKGQENYSLAEGNRLRNELIQPPRGLIFDRNGVPLVKNLPSFSVIIRPVDLPKADQELSVYIDQLARSLGLDGNQLADLIKKNRRKDLIVLEDNLDRDKAISLELKLNGLAGTEIVESPNRSYASLASLGQIVGYIGKATPEDLKNNPKLYETASVGRAGLEKSYDAVLQGQPGSETLEVDSLGRTLRSVGTRPAQPGQSLILSLDSLIQQQTGDSLKAEIEKNGAISGAAVMLDVKTGDVIAMVSFPDFDSNLFSVNIDPAQRQAVLNDSRSPLLNRAIAGQYPSGSTIKPTVAVGALDEGVINANTKLDTTEGKIVIGEWTFPDSEVHGVVDVRQAIAESNNIFFYALGAGYKNIAGLGAEKLINHLEKFGFGQPTGIDIPGEAGGLLPDPTWKKKIKKESWYIGDTYHLAIGQGDFLITPLQMARSTATIANGGLLFKPKLVKSIVTPTNKVVKEISAQVTDSQVAKASSLQIVREGMRRTVESGSAKSFSLLGVKVAAKTGTAQFNVSKDRTHSWFTAFAPYDDPQIAVAVIVEGAGEGWRVAAPVAKNMIEKYFNLPLTEIVPLAAPPPGQ